VTGPKPLDPYGRIAYAPETKAAPLALPSSFPVQSGQLPIVGRCAPTASKGERHHAKLATLFHGIMKMKPSYAALAVLALGQASLPAAAAPARKIPFENLLVRSIAIEGEGDRRFRLAERMAHYRVPGVSVAIIDKCRISEARGFGSAGPGRGPVTAKTLFQAGSLSKTVSAVVALRLVEKGTLALDDDVRNVLKSWTLPDSPQASGEKVTLRRLLNHSAGINQEGGLGYRLGETLPTLLDILHGRAPANTDPIRVARTPGAQWSYSGGGYYILQSMMTDRTGEDFPALVERLLFRPLKMKSSAFAQPLPAARAGRAAASVGPDGTPLDGGWRVNPELAAGGLWSTPEDLARLLIGVSKAVRGEDHKLLRADSAREMMRRGLGNWGLGVDLGPPDGPRRFSHTGHNVGFSSAYMMYLDSCQGAVVMTNADQGGWLVTEVLRAIGEAYSWPARDILPVQRHVPMTDAIAGRFVGTYRLRDFPAERFAITRKQDGGLYWARLGHVGRDLLAEHEGRLFSPDSKMILETDPAAPRAQAIELSFGGGSNAAIRVD
jgi:CubicO group peptidase (beta-lactamase class C family)